MMEENQEAQESTREKVRKEITDNIASGLAVQVDRGVLLEITDEDSPMGTYALGFYGQNVNGEDKLNVIIMDVENMQNLFEMSMKGLIHGRAIELAQQL